MFVSEDSPQQQRIVSWFGPNKYVDSSIYERYGSSSPTSNSVGQGFNSSRQTCAKVEMSSSPAANHRFAYFIIKANTSRVVELSMANNIFAFTPAVERKLLSAVKVGFIILLYFLSSFFNEKKIKLYLLLQFHVSVKTV